MFSYFMTLRGSLRCHSNGFLSQVFFHSMWDSAVTLPCDFNGRERSGARAHLLSAVFSRPLATGLTVHLLSLGCARQCAQVGNAAGKRTRSEPEHCLETGIPAGEAKPGEAGQAGHCVKKKEVLAQVTWRCWGQLCRF